MKVKGDKLRKGHSVIVKYGKDKNYIGIVTNDVQGGGDFKIKFNKKDHPEDAIGLRGKKTKNKGIISWCKKNKSGGHFVIQKSLTDIEAKKYQPDKATIKRYRSGWQVKDRIVVFYSRTAMYKWDMKDKKNKKGEWKPKSKADRWVQNVETEGEEPYIDSQSGYHIGTITSMNKDTCNFKLDYYDELDSFKIGRIKTKRTGKVMGRGTDKQSPGYPLPPDKLNLYFVRPEDVPLQPGLWLKKKLGFKPNRFPDRLKKHNKKLFKKKDVTEVKDKKKVANYDNKGFPPDWQEIRENVLKRDNYQCQDCGYTPEEKGKYLNVHHKIPRGANGIYNHELDNLKTLCIDCHIKIHVKIHGGHLGAGANIIVCPDNCEIINNCEIIDKIIRYNGVAPQNEKQIIRFYYTNAGGDDSVRAVRPIRIARGNNNHCYFPGYCYLQKEQRNFRIHRINSIEKILYENEVPSGGGKFL